MRKRYKQKLLKEHPHCVYCAGMNPATTIDHMPNKGMFPLSSRPKGLEVPCCRECNKRSTPFEDVASFFGALRFEGDARALEHFKKKCRGLLNNQPEILEELMPTVRQERKAANYTDAQGRPLTALDARGPKVSRSMLMYGAKLCLALHWHERGEMLVKTARIAVMWHTNANALERTVPQNLLNLLPEGKTLSQGKFSVRDQFEYASIKTTDSDSSAHWARFGEAFMFHLFAGSEIDTSGMHEANLFSPGFILSLPERSAAISQ